MKHHHYSYLSNILQYSIRQLGEVETIQITNPGINYNHAPYVELWEPSVATKNKQDYTVTIGNQTGSFVINEQVSQNVINTSITQATLNSNPTFTAGEPIYQLSSAKNGTFVANTQTNLIVANTGTGNFTSIFTAGQTIVIGNSDIRVINNIVSSSSMYVTNPFGSINAPYTSNGVANVAVLSAVGVGVTVALWVAMGY